MSARHYLPIYLKHSQVSLIVYPIIVEGGLNSIFPSRQHLIDHITEVYKTHSALHHGQYHVVFAWAKDAAPMLDIWLHTQNDIDDESGPLLEFMGFENSVPSSAPDIASGDTIIALASEEVKRRKSHSLQGYLNDHQTPEFLLDMTPIEEFK